MRTTIRLDDNLLAKAKQVAAQTNRTLTAVIEEALAFADQVRNQTNAVVIGPGKRHWTIFTELCSAVNVKGHLVLDAYLAALAIKRGSEWITTDRDFSRFPNLVWRHPID